MSEHRNSSINSRLSRSEKYAVLKVDGNLGPERLDRWRTGMLNVSLRAMGDNRPANKKLFS
ncbi:hypothetical protein HYPGJ_21114 [Hyphomicrobium sp. GJ21]|nr:hypothetical protein HYPGJ_21114 [Hyphomicrobium sp. GJ21]